MEKWFKRARALIFARLHERRTRHGQEYFYINDTKEFGGSKIEYLQFFFIKLEQKRLKLIKEYTQHEIVGDVQVAQEETQ